MKPSGAFGVVVVLLLVALCGVILAAEEDTPAPFEMPQFTLTDLVIERSAEHENAYACSVTIVDARSGRTLAAPRAVFLSGQEGRMRSGVAAPDGQTAELDIVVSADAQDRTARVRIDLVRDGEPTTLQAIRVSL